MPTLEWVNHAGYIFEQGAVRLICDPWMDGSAFDDGWDLLSPTAIPYSKFNNLTHLWFSHEHPDHFSIPTLKQVPDEAKAKITVLYQASIDRRVPEYCRKLGFPNLIEMQPRQWLSLGEGVELLCHPHDNGDSWLATRTEGLTFLNVNDCVITSPRQCHEVEKLVGHVDVLATQFSYANWVANAGDMTAMRAAAAQKLEWLKTQVLTFQPKYVIPAASFVHFSHADNQYLNLGMNRITQVVEVIRNETEAEPVVLYPGDRWAFDDNHASESAIARYECDFERALADGVRHRSTRIPLAKVIENGNLFVKALLERNGWGAHLLPSVTIFVDDHNRAVTLSPNGVQESDASPDACDLSCKSDALDYCFLYEWGGRTLDINGRFQVPAAGQYWKFKTYATLAGFNSRGEAFAAIFNTIVQRAMARLAA